MSSTAFPYIIGESELKSLYGRGDGGLRARIEAQYADEFAQNDEWFADAITKQGAPHLKDALHELLAGQIGKPGHAFQYVYALELICREVAKLLPNDLFREYHSGWLPTLEFAWDMLKTEDLPIPIPRTDDMPIVYYVSAIVAAQRLKVVEGIDITRQHCWPSGAEDTGEADDDVIDGREQLLSWLKQAVTSQKALLVFEY